LEFHPQFIQTTLEKLLGNEEFLRRINSTKSIFGPVDSNTTAPLLAGVIQKKAPHQKRFWICTSCPKSRQYLHTHLKSWSSSPDSVFLLNKITSSEGNTLSDPEAEAEYHTTLHRLSLACEETEVIIIPPELFDAEAPNAEAYHEISVSAEVGKTLDLSSLKKQFKEQSYDQVNQVHARAQWSQRGCILDIFPIDHVHPIRIELFDEEVESIRTFNIHTQLSNKKLNSVSISLKKPSNRCTIKSYISDEDLIISTGPAPHSDATFHLSDTPIEDHTGILNDQTACIPSPLGHFSAGDVILIENQRKLLQKQLQDWIKDLWSVSIIFTNQSELSRFTEICDESLLHKLHLHIGHLSHGYVIPACSLAVLSSSEIFGKSNTLRRNTSNSIQNKARLRTSLEEIAEGDLVVHSEYGIGRFIEVSTSNEGSEEIHVEYRDGVLLSVPIGQSHLLVKYVGMGGKTPQLSKLGDGKWSKTKQSAQGAIQDYAASLLKIQAERNSRPGIEHAPDDKWMKEFETSFPYRETHGQRESIDDSKADMECSKPMDRLICGDVGFGKTEVAIRALFKAVCGGYQAAVLVPTTVLAEQHWRNFKERMSHYPFRIELLNRFRTPKEIKEIIEGLRNGAIDIVVGTHRLVSGDIEFKKLGLVVIDEEQRFGVNHKEKFKERFKQVDVLTLSATPIPRTLYLSMMGAKDMSTIDTPPPNKVPVETSICGYDERLIKRAIEREINRGGQVFFLHNRVQTIDLMASKISSLIPSARVVVGHGQMDKSELEEIMRTFVSGEADILLATTIIESGIDIPNANTIIIDRADRFGLADLYQLRGRVGRSDRQAYAILLLPRDMVAGNAKKRIDAIKQYTALGSGFKIAMKDLEIRGAGNLLGTKQSGHIASIGFELYCQLLKQSIDHLKGGKSLTRREVQFKADCAHFTEGSSTSTSASGDSLPCYIPISYMQESTMRIQGYRQLAEINSIKSLNKLKKEWKDRFGDLHPAISNLFLITHIKLLAMKNGITSIEIQRQKLMVLRNGNFIMLEGKRFPRLESISTLDKILECITLLESF